MASVSTVPPGLRLLVVDIIRAVHDGAATTTQLGTQRQICRLVADALDTWLDERTQRELGTRPPSTQVKSSQVQNSDKPKEYCICAESLLYAK